MCAHRTRALLLDVGGTLWPDRWPPTPSDAHDQCVRLARAVGSASPHRIRKLRSALSTAFDQVNRGLAQETDVVINRVLATLEPSSNVDASLVRRAMCLPAEGRVGLFPGATEFLAAVKESELRCVIVSNAVVRDEAAYRDDFAALGVLSYLDSVVSSVDAGVRKPSLDIFDIAAARVGCGLGDCIVMGNSEQLDIRPAASLGLFSVRVAIEEPPPSASDADVVACTLDEARTIITSNRWLS